MNAPAATEPTLVKPPVAGLHPSRLQPAEQIFNRWVVMPERNTALVDMLDPAYWAHLSRILKPLDRIEAFADDGSHYWEFHVQDVGPAFAKVKLFREHALDEIAPGATQPSLVGYAVEWSGPHTKWRVMREKDRRILRENFTTKAEAYGFLATHARQVAA